MSYAATFLASLAVVAAGCDGRGAIAIGADRGQGACSATFEDPLQLTALGPTDRSHWLQPWRAYQETWPASRLRRAIGLPFNSDALESRRGPVFAASGVARGITVFQWSSADYEDPTRLNTGSRDDLRAKLTAMRDGGLRPLLVLYGHEGVPAPLRQFKITVAEAAPKGSTRLKLDRAAIASIVPGRTGLRDLTKYKASEVIFTAVDAAGIATLSRPLPIDVPAGARDASTLRFAPFSRPLRADGTANPLFEETLKGWLDFVRATVREAAAVVGTDQFDVELWNELVTGADFLDINSYYDPPFDAGPGNEAIPRAILERTVQALRDPALGLPRLGIGDGFANTVWSQAGSTEAPGVSAMDRHISVMPLRFPEQAIADDSRPLDARGRPSATRGADGVWKDRFTPAYTIDFPELPLTAVLPYKWRRPGQVIRDLAPIDTLDANGVTHGRNARPPGGQPPAVWITSIGTNPAKPAAWSNADRVHFQTKAVLRAASAYVGRGAEVLAFYTGSDELQFVDHVAPDGGAVLRVLARFMRAFEGPETVTPRALTLASVAGCNTGRQFDGDGTEAHPALLNREVVAFFPFQVTEKKWVAPVYVMTRNLTRVQRTTAAPTDVLRFDMPPETFELAIEGVEGRTALVEASDPMLGTTIEVSVAWRGERRVVVAIPLTDAPRLLTITEP